MAFKMKGYNAGEGTGSAHKKVYGTSSKDLSNLSYQERSKYKSWKKSERDAGKKGAHHDNTYEAFLASKGKSKKSKVKRKGQGWQKIKDFFSSIKKSINNK